MISYLALSERSVGQVVLSCDLDVRTGSGNNGACKGPTANQSAQAISLAMQGDHVPGTHGHLPVPARAPLARGCRQRYDRSIIFFFHPRPIRDRSMRHAWSSIHDFVQRRVWYWRTCSGDWSWGCVAVVRERLWRGHDRPTPSLHHLLPPLATSMPATAIAMAACTARATIDPYIARSKS